jgi:translin
LALKTILSEAKKQLTSEEEVREDAHISMRSATSLSKRAILLIHQKRMEEAKVVLQSAREIIIKINKLANEHPSLIYGGMFSAALQEYSEANVFLTLIQENRFINPKEIKVPPVDFILGLADVIGEYRRLILDLLRERQVEKGAAHLETMDEIYTELMAIDEAYMLVPGLRRKCDVGRKIIETTRGDITQEISRKSLEDHLRHFEQKHFKGVKHKEQK